jgi:hypothetical protein
MPSGYTSDIYNGKEVSGKDFLLTCARAFGACIEMRDEDSDVPIPEKFEISDYHEKNFKNAQEELEKYKTMSIEEAELLSQTEFQKDQDYRSEEIKKINLLKERYKRTLSEVRNWTPPTDEHKELKEFTIDQLKQSIDFDCDISYLEKPKKRLVGQEWLNSKIKECYRDVEYHAKEHLEEIERTDGRNNWIKQLRESLQ